MPKNTRKFTNADGSQKQRPTNDTASEITVRAYDRRMRDRFAEILRAISILLDVCDGKITEDKGESTISAINISAGRNVFNAVQQNVASTLVRLRALISHYDLIAIAYLINDANNRFYFSTMSCENFDAELWNLCDQIHQQITQIVILMDMIECTQARPQTKGTKRTARKPPGSCGATLGSCGATLGSCGATLGSCGATLGSCGTAHSPDDKGKSFVPSMFLQLRKALQVADACVERAMTWSHPIFKQGIDILQCESCGTRVRILQDMSESICDHCGKISIIIGSSQIDEVAPNGMQEDSRGRRGGYTYMRHLRIWLDRLQAIENFEFDAGDMAKLRASIESEYISRELVNWRAIRCQDVIRHLELCGLSSLGEHAPKLVKELGGRSPPILDYESEQIIVRDFMHIMDIYAHLYHEPGNKPYYPFFIGKVIRRRFRPESDIYRMLSYISHQGYDTVKKNDHIYQQICSIAPKHYDLKYSPEIE